METEELKKANPLHKEFQSLLDEDFKDRKLKENEIIKAVVTEITKNFIVVDCKAKMEGMIPIEEFKNDDELSKLKVGSAIDVYLERIESFKGEIVISRDKARKMKSWKKMEKVFDTQEELTGYITGKVKGGFICTVDSLACFMPSSQIDIRPLKKVDHLMNTPVKVIATRIDKNRGNVCVSRRAVLEKSKNAEIIKALKNIKEGDIVEDAIVKATTDWGIFLDINSVDALLHVSDLSHGRVKKPADLVTIGQKLKVKITKIDEKTNRVSASVKALTEAEIRFVSGSIFVILTFIFCPMVTRSAGFLTLPCERSVMCKSASKPFISKKIPQSVVARTFASSIISPSFKSFKISFASASLFFSNTALRLVHTLPRFLSILVAITLTGVFIK